MPLKQNPTPAQAKPSALVGKIFRLTQEPRLLQGSDLTLRQTPTIGHKLSARTRQKPIAHMGQNLAPTQGKTYRPQRDKTATSGKI